MKFIITLLLALESAVVFAGAGDEWASLSVALQSLPDKPIVSFVFKGSYFESAIPLEKQNGEVDHRSPRSLARTLFKIFNEQNTSLYPEVFNKKASETGYTPNSNNVVSSMSLRAEMQYGDYTILALEQQVPLGKWMELFYFKKENEKYFGVWPAPRDAAIQLLESYINPGWMDKIKFDGKQNYAIDSAAGAIFTNFLKDTDKFPMILEFSGTNFNPPIKIEPDQVPVEDIHASPEGVFKWAVTHTKLNHQDGYLTLIDPDDLQQPADSGTIESSTRSKVPRAAQLLTKKLTITRKIFCADLAYIFYKPEDAGENVRGWWIVVRKKGDRWYLSNALLGDKERAGLCYPILRYFKFPSTAYPNLFPIVKNE